MNNTEQRQKKSLNTGRKARECLEVLKQLKGCSNKEIINDIKRECNEMNDYLTDHATLYDYLCNDLFSDYTDSILDITDDLGHISIKDSLTEAIRTFEYMYYRSSGLTNTFVFHNYPLGYDAEYSKWKPKFKKIIHNEYGKNIKPKIIHVDSTTPRNTKGLDDTLKHFGINDKNAKPIKHPKNVEDLNITYIVIKH